MAQNHANLNISTRNRALRNGFQQAHQIGLRLAEDHRRVRRWGTEILNALSSIAYLKELKEAKQIMLLPGDQEISVRQSGYADFTRKIRAYAVWYQL